MLDNTQTVVARTTIENAVHLVCAISSQIFGNTLPQEINREVVSEDLISKLVVADIRSTLSIKGVSGV